MKQVEAELKLQSRKSLSFPPTTNTSKLQLHVEQLSLSIIWKLEEYLCYEKGYKERTAAAKSLQTCPTLCDPIDDSLPGSPVPGILQARTLEWAAVSFSIGWKWKVKVKSLSHVRLFGTPWTAAHQALLPMGFSRQQCWNGLLLTSPKKELHGF